MGGNIDYGLTKDNYRLNYFSIPALLKYQLDKSWTVLVGPQADFIIQGQKEYWYRSPTVLTKQDLCSGGIEAWVIKNVVIGGRYSMVLPCIG